MHHNKKGEGIVQAIILAAGRGLRLGAGTKDRPKCLLEIGGKPLIKHQIDALRSLGIDRIHVVVGFLGDKVCDTVGHDCHCITNARYAETNSLYSLRLALKQIQGPTMLLNSDVLAHREVYVRVAQASGSCLAFDSSSDCEEEEMKVSFVNGRLRAISKDLSKGEADGENVGILKFDADTVERLTQEADAIINDGAERCWAPAVLHNIADQTVVRGIDVADLPWTEIDFAEDLAFARDRIWPGISNGHSLKGGTNMAFQANAAFARVPVPKPT